LTHPPFFGSAGSPRSKKVDPQGLGRVGIDIWSLGARSRDIYP
jgi:hypothetical protein